MAGLAGALGTRAADCLLYTSVLHLDDSGRRQELARLIGGSMITETTWAGAAELLRLADKAKKGI